MIWPVGRFVMVSTLMTGHLIESKLGYPNQPLVDIGPGGKPELTAVARIEYPSILERTVANEYLICDLFQLYLTFAILEIRFDDDVIKILIVPGSADFCGEAFQATKHHGNINPLFRRSARVAPKRVSSSFNIARYSRAQ